MKLCLMFSHTTGFLGLVLEFGKDHASHSRLNVAHDHETNGFSSVRQLLDTGLEAKDRKKMWLLLGSHIEHHIGVLKSFKALSQMHYCETVACGTKVS
ncbi:MAG: hypothetical protein U0Z75_00740 [Deinococcaceae bacterium]